MTEAPKVMTAEAARAPLTGAVSAPKPIAPTSPVPLSAQVNRAMAATAPVPKDFIVRSTKEITSPWFRGLIYGETNARKTTTAARFGTPENVRIIANRGEDQLIPLRDMGYRYALCDTMEKLRYAMTYPENLWPEWAGRDDRIVVIDDYTKAHEMIVEDNEYNDKGNLQNNMLKYGGANKDMTGLTKSLFNKPMHIIGVAFASITENELTHEENVGPNLSKGMRQMLTAEFTFCFYIDKKAWMFVTDDKRESYQDHDEKMQLKTFNRVIFAKSKVPYVEGRKPLNQMEPMDLRAVWNKVNAGASK